MAKSIIKRALSSDGGVRIIFIDSTEIVRESCRLHHTSKTMTATLGRALTATALMSSLLKDKDNTLTFRLAGDGPCGNVVCVGDYMGNVRGYADDMTVELPPHENGKLNVGGAVGGGSMYVIKDLGMNEPYVGVSNIVSGEIAEDVTNYFAESEQTPTVCALGVRVDNDNMCYAAGGYLIQLMPGYEDRDIDIIETNVKMAGSVSKQIADGLTVSARAADGVVEAYEGNGIICVQFHPEGFVSKGDSRFLPIFEEFVSESRSRMHKGNNRTSSWTKRQRKFSPASKRNAQRGSTAFQISQ